MLQQPGWLTINSGDGLPFQAQVGLTESDPSVDSRALFNKLMVWGLSMTLVGSAICWLLFTVLEVGLG